MSNNVFCGCCDSCEYEHECFCSCYNCKMKKQNFGSATTSEAIDNVLDLINEYRIK